MMILNIKIKQTCTCHAANSGFTILEINHVAQLKRSNFFFFFLHDLYSRTKKQKKRMEHIRAQILRLVVSNNYNKLVLQNLCMQ